MMFFGRKHSSNSSKDANSFAPCFRSAKKSFNSVSFAGIVLSMSVFLYFALCIICAIEIISIIGIIILSIIIIRKIALEKRTAYGLC